MSTQSLDWGTDSELDIKYTHHSWGEFIFGTKTEIERFGIAVGKAFPGEVGGPKCDLKVADPRGFPTSIAEARDGRYYVHIRFPGRSQHEVLAATFSPGVQLRTDLITRNEYVGSADALCAAGLVQPHQLPGQPGMRKMRVTIYADGTIPSGAPTANDCRSDEPGAMMIERRSKTKFRVWVHLPKEEQELRRQSQARAREEYEARMRALPRPPPLRPCAAGASHPAPTASNVIDLRAARTAKSAVSTKKDGERFLFDVTQSESCFLSYFYENGHEKSALRLLKIAESGPDWDPNRGYLSRVYVTDGEVDFLRFMSRKGPVAAARALMKSVNKPLPGEEGSWGKVLSITPALRLASPTAPRSLVP